MLEKQKTKLEMSFLHLYTLRSQTEGYTQLLFFKKFSVLPTVIWAYPFINFQEIFQPPCFFTYTIEIFSTLPTFITMLEPTSLLNLKKNSGLPFY